MASKTFKIIPVMGRRVDVPADSSEMLEWVELDEDEGAYICYSYDAGGVNFDLGRKRMCCSKSYGSVEWSNSANSQATKCLGLFELWDGTNRNHIYFDNGKCFIFDSALDPQVKEDAGSTTFANDDGDRYSIVQVGDYMVFADRAEHTPYKWKHGDAALTKLIQAGTEFKFRFLSTFQRRVIGMYSDQTDGDIEVRWSTPWPDTAITSMEFSAANQLYVPNDDRIRGGKPMGRDYFYIYSDDSIHQMTYYEDYETPFGIITTVSGQGAAGHHGIIALGDRHYLFNRHYGFCEYRGGSEFPYGGKPISSNIENDLWGINPDYYSRIVGTHIPLQREVVWAVPHGSNSTPDHFYFYNYETNQWRIEDKAYRFIDSWRMNENYTWADFLTDMGSSTAIWTAAGTNTWAYYTSMRQRLVYGGTDGKLYYQSGESLAGSDLDAYRVEPILDLGYPYNYKFLQEIWFGLAEVGNFSIDVSYRTGNTAGECAGASWTSLGSLSCNSPSKPCIHCGINARYFQIKWGTDLADEKFAVNHITFSYELGSDI